MGEGEELLFDFVFYSDSVLSPSEKGISTFYPKPFQHSFAKEQELKGIAGSQNVRETKLIHFLTTKVMRAKAEPLKNVFLPLMFS